MFYFGRVWGIIIGFALFFFHFYYPNQKTIAYNLLIIALFGLFIVWLGSRYDKANNEVDRRLKTENKLKESEDRYRNLVELSPLAIIVHQLDKIIYVNPFTVKSLGASSNEELLGKSIYDFIHIDYHERTKHRLKEVLEGKDIGLTEQMLIKINGEVIYAEVSAFVMTYSEQNVVLSVLNDITDRKKSENKINHMAYYDALTNLPNRYNLDKCLLEALELPKDSHRGFSIMFIDLDRFKMINDTFGHGFGDLLLQQVAERLHSIIKKEERIFRYGGDEFIIIIESMKQEEVSQVAIRILGEFNESFNINNREVFITPSIGISSYPEDGADKETLIKNADAAMYFAKEKGRNIFKWYTSNLNNTFLEKMNLENDLRKALDNDEFYLTYQPQIDLSSGKIIGVEALIRWQHPRLGLISPASFIPIAEETGLIVPIGKWIFKTAINQNKEWQKKGYPHLRIAINISVRQFQDSHFVDTIIQALEDSQLDPQYVDLEITESVMQNIKESTVLLKQLKRIGLYLSIDDFGTGYSSLSLLRNLPIDNLKIDQSFIYDLMNNVQALAIVKTIIDMGRNLELDVVAEGIENEHQLSTLKKIKCTYGQGYYFNKPLSKEEIEQLLMENISYLMYK